MSSLQEQRACENAYQSIVTLNNAGINLLVSRKYTDAVETFQDAIKLMRTSFFCGTNDGSSTWAFTSLPPREDFDRALQAAWLRTRQDESREQDGLNLVVFSDLASPREVYEELENDAESLFCVVLEPSVEKWCDIDMERLECESGLLLYNYGIAHRCAALTDHTMDATLRHHVEESAMRIFELSQTVANKSIPYAMDDEPMMATTSTEILLAFLVTASLLQMSTSDSELCHQYRGELLDLLTTLSHQEMMLSMENIILAAAAA